MRTAGGFEPQLEERNRSIAVGCQPADDVAQVLGEQLDVGRSLGEVRVNVGIGLLTFTDAEEDRGLSTATSPRRTAAMTPSPSRVTIWPST